MTTADLGVSKKPEVGFDLLSEISSMLHADLSAISRVSKSLLSAPAEHGSADENREDITQIADTCANLLSAVGQIMDIADLEQGAVQFTEQEISLGDVLDSAYKRIVAAARDNSITISTVNAAADLRVIADRSRLEQIIDNLLINALKETPEGGTVTIEAGLRDDTHAVLSIADTGAGIAPAVRHTLFEPFAGNCERPDADSRGLGLELPIAGRLTAAIGCILKLDSAIGSGARFEVVFPQEKTIGLPEHHASAAG